MLGLAQLGWTSVEREFDPFKYNSFAVNAGVQARRITLMVQAQLESLAKAGRMGEMPPILAFHLQSEFHGGGASREARLEPLRGRDELVVFDINNLFEMRGLVSRPLRLETLLTGTRHAYRMSMLTNRDPRATIVHDRMANLDVVTSTETGLEWPATSIRWRTSPCRFRPGHPLYGAAATPNARRFNLGRIMLRGENGVLEILRAP